MAVAGDGNSQAGITHERPEREGESSTLTLAFLWRHRDDEPSIVAAHQMDELFIYQLQRRSVDNAWVEVAREIAGGGEAAALLEAVIDGAPDA